MHLLLYSSHAGWLSGWTDTLPHFPTHARTSLKRARGARVSSRGTRRADRGVRIMCSPRAESRLHRAAEQSREELWTEERLLSSFTGVLPQQHLWDRDLDQVNRRNTPLLFDLHSRSRWMKTFFWKSMRICCCESFQLLRFGANKFAPRSVSLDFVFTWSFMTRRVG